MEEALRRLITEGKGYVDIQLYVKPEANFTGLRMEAGELVFYTEEPPLEGRANASIVRFFSRLFGVQPAKVDIVYGHRSRTKRIRIYDVDLETALEKIVEALRESEQTG
jgi:uncharacterized protein (TIGR00251 family)